DNRRNAPSAVPLRGMETEEEATDIQADFNIQKESPNAAQLPRPTEAQDSVDGMASITFADETSSGFFGPISNSAFLQVLLEAQTCIFRQRGTASSSLSASNNPNPTSLSRPSSPPTLAGVSTTPADLSTERGGMSASSGNPYIIPPQHKILRLIDIFFENTGKFFPYLYKPDIIRFVTNMRRSGFKQVEGAHLCLLNLIMAFAVTHSTFSLPVAVKKERGDVFLERALALLPHVKATADSLEPIQALVMATQYIQGTRRSSQTWGMMCALVQASFQIELRKRTWWMCLILDKMCSMSYGRPPLIPTSYMTVDLPTNVELEKLDDNSNHRPQASTVPSTASLILYTKLYLILGTIIENVYDNNIRKPLDSSQPHHTLIQILEAEKRLTQWKAELPPEMAQMTVSELDTLPAVIEPEPYRFRVVLTLRFLHVRLLLHRIMLSQLLDTSETNQNMTSPAELWRMGGASVDVCTEAAADAIAILSKTAQHQDLLPVWWYSVYFTSSAALVIYGSILAIYRYDIKAPPYSPQELVRILQTSLDVVAALGGDTRQVLRCQKVIRHLLQASLALVPPRDVASEGVHPEGGHVLQGQDETGFMPTDPSFSLSTDELMRQLGADIPIELSLFPEDLSFGFQGFA
ncbi:hypothetical protein FALBO_16028, partial [Fusarium albosuccineum]